MMIPCEIKGCYLRRLEPDAKLEGDILIMDDDSGSRRTIFCCEAITVPVGDETLLDLTVPEEGTGRRVPLPIRGTLSARCPPGFALFVVLADGHAIPFVNLKKRGPT